MSYGHFDDAAREYVITRPDTPLPWINYLGCEEYFGIVSHCAGGYSFYRDARLRRLTRYRYNDVPLDSNGRYVYVREPDGTVWNPMWKPARTPLDAYECRHGLGYTTITGRRGDVEVRVRYFVPLGLTAEVWDVQVVHHGQDEREISLFGFVEWCLWDALDDQTNFQRNFSTGEVEVDPGVIFHKTEYRERRSHFAYFACTEPAAGFDTARDAFVGVHDGLDRPRAVVAGRCTGSVARGWAPVGAHQVNLTLRPGGRRRFQFVLGYAENPPEAKWSAPGVINRTPYDRAMNELAGDAEIDAALGRLAEHWSDRLGRYQVDVDDEHVARMANVWNAYQCATTLNLSRSASLFESGIGRGMGYRDSNQDILGVVHMEPERSRQRLCDLAATQLSDGTCFHQYQPLTKQGNADIGGGFNDDPLWLVLSVAAYIKETGDASVLSETVGYADVVDRSATVLKHLELSLRYTETNVGPHGLPLIGHADWNDCLNLNCFSTDPDESFQTAGDVEGSAAESVMIAGLYCHACDEMAGIYRAIGRDDAASSVERRGEAMRATLREHAWDGEWFLRAYDARGRKIGGRECQEGRIFIESQGWCVMGRVGLDDGLAVRAMDSVAEHLATPDGVVLHQPPYRAYHVHLGEISSYPPGYKENAGIFTHNNTWVQIAETILGRGDRAMDYWRSVCPSLKQDKLDTYRCEPYVYAQMTAGPDAPSPGEAKNSWLTGTASWSLVAVTQYILGVRPGFDGLLIDPCIPPHWRQYAVRRRWRGKTYEIAVRNPDGASKGVRRVTVDGEAIEGNVVSPDLGGEIVAVDVEMG